MTELPPLMRDQRKADTDHLRLLSIFHFVAAGLAVLGICFLAAHYMLFHAVVNNPEMWKNQKGATPPPAQIFAILKWFYVLGAVWFASSGVLNLLSGMFLARRKLRTFSLVVAVMNCIHIPLGTVLGVFTIIVLLRPSVREVYEAQPAA